MREKQITVAHFVPRLTAAEMEKKQAEAKRELAGLFIKYMDKVEKADA